jgi:hypothetical protein
MIEIRCLTERISRDFLKVVAEERFGDMVKAVVDVNKAKICIGGELHSDIEEVMLKSGSLQVDLWGINLYPDFNDDNFVEFDSMINIRPSQNNKSRGVEDLEIQKRIIKIVKDYVE